jgi:hypothetical protein
MSSFAGLLFCGFGGIAEDFLGNSFILGVCRIDFLRQGVGLRLNIFRIMSGNLAFVDLAIEILIFVGMVEHLCVIRIRQNFGSVSQENNSASLVATERLQLAVHVYVVAAIAIIKVMMNAWTSELRYFGPLARL